MKGWSVDMFSLGAILLEILTGVPLWLSMKARIDTPNGSILSYGLFAVKGKEPHKIAQKQKETIKNLRTVLKNHCSFMQDEVTDFLERMIRVEAGSRMSPREALSHPFLANCLVIALRGVYWNKN
eukprot:TRINITY_DN14459_c0_g1_i1.p1 TRINITY_DN14459_c0_g1~~TRINITY_DN14459_c0_g1_i1.p1  ORF type:complete len:125 (+),score=12.40 TRINITY_DN14459_c0_g1_i1:138-512(+)